MLKIDDIIEIEISAYGADGMGIAKHGDFTVFVERVAVGDKIKAKITYVKKNIAYAKPVKLVAASSARVEPSCPVYSKCGGCQLMHLNYREQLEYKRATVKNNLAKIGGIDFDVPPVAPSDKIFRYRNKLNMPFGTSGGAVVSGLFENDSHNIVPISDCLLQQEWAAELVETVKAFMAENGISAYDERAKRGLVRHVVARFVAGQLLVTVVVNGETLPKAEILLARLVKKFGEVGLFVNVNKKDTNVILGDKTEHIGGICAIMGEQFGVAFSLKPQSFYQVNDGIKDKIYSKVKELLAHGNTEVLIDAYSGIGILSGALYSENYQTFAIEIEPSAVSDADEMKRRNGLKNLTNICGDVGRELGKVVENNRGKNIALVVDPPRKGLGAAVCQTVLSAMPTQIVYISCDSATLARDLKMLAEGGYCIDFLQPYDMFPQTRHVETLVLLCRK